MEVIRVRAPTRAHAASLLALLDGGFSADGDGGFPTDGDGGFSRDGDGGTKGADIRLALDGEAALKLVELFDALGRWLTDSGLDACQIGFGERAVHLRARVERGPERPAK